MRPVHTARLAAVLALPTVALPAAAQSGGFAGGDLALFTPALNGISSSSGGLALVGVLSGTVTEPYAFWTTPSASDACAYDPFRDRLVFAAAFQNGDPVELWAGDAAGVAQKLLAASGAVRVLAPAGDGRVFFNWNGGPFAAISWLDAADQLHVLMDASGTAPWTHGNGNVLIHLEYDEHANALLLASGSFALACSGPAASALTVRRLDLSADGTRVVGESCASFDVDPMGGEVPVGLARIDPEAFLLTVDTNSNQAQPRLLRVTVDPLGVEVYSSTDYFGSAATNAGTYSHTLGRAVLLDTGNDVLRTYAPGQGGAGSVLPTSSPLSPAGSSGEAATLVEIGPRG
ncbi:MAG TPA: hypothetical protein VJP77_07220, partial [Planctomycetota bacterium]|nr:hypothetical protein [Planctomycetota bacterium]